MPNKDQAKKSCVKPLVIIIVAFGFGIFSAIEKQ